MFKWLESCLVLRYYEETGVVDEGCIPYKATCDSPCTNNNPTERIKIGGRKYFATSTLTEDVLKRLIIKYGPISAGIISQEHAMTLAGYYRDTSDGKIVWIFKNSWGGGWNGGNLGEGWGVNGWAYIKVDISDIGWVNVLKTPVQSLHYTDADIVCEDKDGDGYYYWGIGPKPLTCPPCSSDEEDGDDSNYNLGPMDEDGNCKVNLPITYSDTYVSSTQTWSTDQSLCGNLYIQSGGTLTISSTAKIPYTSSVFIQSGGKMIISGGKLINANITAETGGRLSITNNGEIILNGNDNLNIKSGATFDLITGDVKINNE